MKIGGLRTRTSYFKSLACLRALVVGMLIVTVLASHSAVAANIKGQVMGGGARIAQSTVILMQASAGEPRQLAQAKTDSNGNFAMHGTGAPGSSLYLIASGGIPGANKAGGNNPAILLLSVVGNKPPASVVIDEMTTIASVFTHAQFIVGTSIKGSPLALGIAAGNVPNLVDLETGGLGPVIQDPLNSSQTATLGDLQHAGEFAGGLHHAGPGRRVQQALRGRHASGWRCAQRHANGGGEHRTQSIAIKRRQLFRATRCVLSRPRRRALARGALHPLPQLRAECVDPVPGLCRWRVELAGRDRH